jgi:1-acyl-sn-glycerol-3-phosphate acyltransferase
MDDFADIRPYQDEEVAPVLAKLVSDPELLAALAKLKAPVLSRFFGFAVRPLLKLYLRRELRGVTTVRDFQLHVEHYMDQMIEGSTRRFTVSGIEDLDPKKSYLFISNHRDIALDPAFLSYALYHNGQDTVRIAIGDNLLSKPFAADLMRLNKSFIVRRSAKGPRQMLAAYRKLSAYIRHSLLEERESIWIAQREGRAKDGNDATETAVIKMICMAQDKEHESFADYVNNLNIVPVSIAYEWDPLDVAKAQELVHTARDGAYQKAEHEDLKSIAAGILGDKGDVNVHFGKPLQGDYVNAVAVAADLDTAIIQQYRLYDSNILAYQAVVGDDRWQELDAEVPDAGQRAAFDNRMSAIPTAYRQKVLEIYANPVINKLRRQDMQAMH